MTHSILQSLLVLATFFGIVQAQHQNILMSEANNPNEPAIIIDPSNTNRMVAAANLNNTYSSNDGGLTWITNVANSDYGVWGDPVVGVDASGHFYYFHLSNPPVGNWIDRIVCQKSTDGGLTWSPGTYTGLNGTKAQDKHWSAFDFEKNAIFLTWTQFDRYGSREPQDSSNILFSKSLDGGESWSIAKRINQVAGDCIDDDNTVEGAVPCVGPHNEIYVSWAGPEGIVFDKSSDGGETWLEEDVFVATVPGGWAYDIPEIQRANGLPVTACDASGGEYNGTVYINWSDQRNGEADTDIWLSKSTDGGQTWSEPRRVNDDPPGKQQFFTWMTIDQSNGNLYFVFYDRRNYNDELTDVYMAFSRDGGESFTNFKVSDSPFLPTRGVFFGDYTNISAHEDVIRPIWTRLHNGSLSMWTAIIQPELIPEQNNPSEVQLSKASLDQNFPNPFAEQTFISFKLHIESFVTLKIFTVNGAVAAVIFRDRKYTTGTYIESFNAEKYTLPSGTYFYGIEVGGKLISKKMIVVK
ncbi:T9SS type A sorting domain-containing protein [candidate division KSB1 bacterium]|nr:T9SS type A sorting domain-containing protein [candidate division KSB1 bacterium]